MKERIVKESTALFLHKGFQGTTIKDITDAVGLTKGAFYWYFKSKDDLINEINRMLEKNILMVVEKDFPSNNDIKKRFFHLSKTVITYFIANPVHFRFIEQYFYSPYGEARHKERISGENEEFEIFRQLIEQGIKEKVLKDLPVFMHFALAFGPVVILARNHVFGLVKLEDVQINQAIEAFWDAIKR